MRVLLRLVLSGSVLSALACGPSGNPPNDGGGDVLRMETGVDVSVDVLPDENVPDVVQEDVPPARLGSRCSSNTACANLGPEALCDERFPGGFCTQRCSSDAACGMGFSCVNQRCLRSCTITGGECVGTEVCNTFDPMRPMARACQPSCYENPPTGQSACNTGRRCNPYAGTCEENFMTPRGSENGIGCARDMECKSQLCIPERNPSDNMFTSYLGGMCFSTARTPPDSDYRGNTPLPRSNCPVGSVAIPTLGRGEGNVALCFRECRTDRDCARAGYECKFLEFNGLRTTTGFCDILNCLDPRIQGTPNMGCPTGTTCVQQMVSGTTPVGFCTPRM